MRFLLLLSLLLPAAPAIAIRAGTCVSTMANPVVSLLSIQMALEELKLKGSLKTQEETLEFLNKFKSLSLPQKKFLLPQILKQLAESKKTLELSNKYAFISERDALSKALGIVHNPLEKFNEAKPQSASQFLENFLTQRKAPYNLSNIKNSIKLLRQNLKSPQEYALIFGSFPNAYARANSDIDVVWKRDGGEAISDGDLIALNRSLKKEEGPLKKLYFSHGTYDSQEQQFFSSSSKLNIEVYQDRAYLLLYPADFEVNSLGIVTSNEPLRILLDE